MEVSRSYKQAQIEKSRQAFFEGSKRPWDQAISGRRAHTLIPSIAEWIQERRELDIHTTQMVAGYGYFSAYLHRIGRSDSAVCWYGCQDDDTPTHYLLRYA